MQVVLNTHGLVVKVRNKAFYIAAGDDNRQISPEQVTSIAVTAPCMLSSAAIELAAEAGIPIYFFDRTGDAQSCLRSPYFESLATLRRKQVYFSDSEAGAAWVIEQFRHKTAHQVVLLQFLKNRKAKMGEEIDTCIQTLNNQLEELSRKSGPPGPEWSAALMGWEGNQARIYWQTLARSLTEAWYFETRSRRPAKDAFNALINYAYGMLYARVEQALFAAGLDPHLGILHADEYDRPTLSYDLIEPFRPWIDRFVVESLLKGEIENTFFEAMEGGVYLAGNGKRYLIPAFNAWMLAPVRFDGAQMSREAHIFRSAALLAKSISQTMQRP
jgi:CRISPR-associated protein Cas1